MPEQTAKIDFTVNRKTSKALGLTIPKELLLRADRAIDRTQCELYWQRAKVWISSNSYYRVQLSSDSVIETYGPFAGRMELAYRILKIPDGAGGARITVAAECGNVFRCNPTVTDAIVAFKRFTSTGG